MCIRDRYLTEYDPETRIAFGYVTGLAFDEWGTVSIDELADIGWCGIPRIEIDKFFKKTRSSEIIGE